MSIIRKLSVGANFPDGAIHYRVGKVLDLQGKSYTISRIEGKVEEGVKVYVIYLTGELDTVEWKRVEGLPVSIEYDINFK